MATSTIYYKLKKPDGPDQFNIGDFNGNADIIDDVMYANHTAIDLKQDVIKGGASTITSDNLTDGRALVSDGNGKVAVSAVTSTELGYLDGVTSRIQTQLDSIVGTKFPTAGGTFTGAVVAQSNDNYTTKQVRNVILSTDEPTNTMGANGDIWLIYEE